LAEPSTSEGEPAGERHPRLLRRQALIREQTLAALVSRDAKAGADHVSIRGVVAEIDAVLDGPTALPRDNGELVFEEPWQGRALGMGVAVIERYAIPRAEFRDRLAEAIALRQARPGESVATSNYACWLDAVEAVLGGRIT
jgi:hypothetical protein